MNIKHFLLLIALLVVGVIQGQSLQDIQNIKVDNLSDAQIEQLIKRAESNGLSEEQMEVMALERGMPASEVAKLRERIMALKSGGGEQPVQAEKVEMDIFGREVEGKEDLQAMFDSIRKSDPYYDLSPLQKKIFGFKLFHNRELDFDPNMNIPTPQNYIIGAGDQLLIDIYGASQQNYELSVSPDGSIFIPNVGPVELAGMSIGSATSKLRSRLSGIYSGLTGDNPSIFLDVRLGNTRTIQISLVGELRKPGTYKLPPFASVFNAMYAAGGPNVEGTFRHIQVYRDNELLGEVDIYDFLLGGQNSSIMLRDNDVVIVQPLRNRVEITGAVRRPGLFEMKPDESLEDLLRFAGGFTGNAYKERITVKRTTGAQMKVDDIGADFFGTFEAKDGDVFSVGEVLKRYENRIQATGAVFRPGEFALTEGMTVLDLIEKAGGLRGDAFTNRVTLYRMRDNLQQEVLSIDLENLMNGDTPDIELQREDVLNVASMYDLKEEFYVTISGEVNRTGVYPYAEDLTVGDLVMRARGLKESASNSYIEISRRIKGDPTGEIAEILRVDINPDLQLKSEDSQLALKPFDRVFVRKSPNFRSERIVKVEGEVFYPGDFVLGKADERISDVLKRAGGLNKFAYPEGATLIRRTEHFMEPREEDRKIKTLEALLATLHREDSLGRSETEAAQIERVERQVQLLRQEKLKKLDSQSVDEDEFLTDRYRRLDEKDALDLREAELVGIELDKIMDNPGSKYDLILEEGDVLHIPKELQTVRMRGEVLYPTTARYDNKKSFTDYISGAGGFTEDSRKRRSYVVYANGEVKQTKSFLGIKSYPEIRPGAEIIVPKKPQRQPISPQGWVSISTGLATLALLLSQLIGL